VKVTRESLFTILNLHLLLAAILAITNIVLLTRLVLAWNTLRTDRPEQIASLKTELKVLELQTQPLRGLPDKVAASNAQATKFYASRVPANYSTISAELNDLAQKNNVRLARVAYVPKPISPTLEEVRMDASLAGEYAPIMRYINGLERDKLFFIIRGLTFTGQQGGTVNLRLNVTTYIHAADANDLTPPASSKDADAAESGPSAQMLNPSAPRATIALGGQ
jgi:type IV pilus assembly protein PilO